MIADLVQPSPVAAFFVFVFTALGTAATVVATSLMLARQVPTKLLAAMKELQERVDSNDRDVRSLIADWKSTINDLESLEESIEKKRRKVSGYVAKDKQQAAAAVPAAPPSPDQMLAHYRQQTYGGANGGFARGFGGGGQ